MGRQITHTTPRRGTSENVQTTFMLPLLDRQRLLYAAGRNGETPSQYLRRIVRGALDHDAAFSAPLRANEEGH